MHMVSLPTGAPFDHIPPVEIVTADSSDDTPAGPVILIGYSKMLYHTLMRLVAQQASFKMIALDRREFYHPEDLVTVCNDIDANLNRYEDFLQGAYESKVIDAPVFTALMNQAQCLMDSMFFLVQVIISASREDYQREPEMSAQTYARYRELLDRYKNDTVRIHNRRMGLLDVYTRSQITSADQIKHPDTTCPQLIRMAEAAVEAFGELPKWVVHTLNIVNATCAMQDCESLLCAWLQGTYSSYSLEFFGPNIKGFDFKFLKACRKQLVTIRPSPMNF